MLFDSERWHLSVSDYCSGHHPAYLHQASYSNRSVTLYRFSYAEVNCLLGSDDYSTDRALSTLMIGTLEPESTYRITWDLTAHASVGLFLC